jgi:protein phosphatase
VPLDTAYGLAKHRDGRWEWAVAPGISPSARYQHAAVFVNARLHVSGGALGGGRMVEDASSIAVLDTAAGVWCDRRVVVTSPRTGRYSNDASGGDAASELTRRCRHAAAAVDDLIFVYGGLRGGMAGCHSLCLYCFLLLIKLWQIPDGPNNITSPHSVFKAMLFERCCS